MNQENLSIVNNYPGLVCSIEPPCTSIGNCIKSFAFQQPRNRIDWKAIYNTDIGHLVSNNDIDSLEKVVDVVAFGDIEAEDTRNLTPLNFIKLFRIAQLTVEYLLFVQDQLAADNCKLKSEAGKLHKNVNILQLKVKEQREEVTANRKELRSMKRAMRTMEALALASKPVTHQQPEVQIVEKVVQTIDPVTQYKLERMEAEIQDLTDEREKLQREMIRLKDALASSVASGQSDRAPDNTVTAAVEAARREERAVAEERLRQVLDQERHANLNRSTNLSMVGESGEMQALREKLAEALARHRELEKKKDLLELELVHALGSPKRMPASNQVQQLRADLHATKDEINMLKEQSKSMRSGSREFCKGQPACNFTPGVGQTLEDASETSDIRLDQMQSEVDALRHKLKHALIENKALKQTNQDLIKKLALKSGNVEQAKGKSHSRDWRDAEIKRLDNEVAQLRKQVCDLQKENAELHRKKGGGKSVHGSSSMLPQCESMPSAQFKAHYVGSSQKMPHESSPKEKAEQPGLGSPIEDDTGAGESERLRHPNSPSRRQLYGDSKSQYTQEQRQTQSPEVKALYKEDRLQPSRQLKQTIVPESAEWQQQFEKDMCCNLEGHERPGVVSRFHHSLMSMLHMRQEVLDELNAEVEHELSTYGIDPQAKGLTNAQLRNAMEELDARREDARVNMTIHDRMRMDYARHTVSHHIDKIAEQMSRLIPEEEVIAIPNSLKPIRTRSDEQEREKEDSVQGWMCQDPIAPRPSFQAFYSPLRSGASQMSCRSDEGYSPKPGGTPFSARSAGPVLDADGGPPRSPWSITHDKVFHSHDVGECASPLQLGAHVSSVHKHSAPGSPACHVQRSSHSRSNINQQQAGQVQAHQSPTRHQSPQFAGLPRYPPEADLESPVHSPTKRGIKHVEHAAHRWSAVDSRDLSTDAAEAIRPPAGFHG